jgi:hypothetical protein
MPFADDKNALFHAGYEVVTVGKKPFSSNTISLFLFEQLFHDADCYRMKRFASIF